MFKSISECYKSICIPPFSEEEIANIKSNKKVRESNKWDKHLAQKGFSNKNGNFLKYQSFIIAGYVQSKVSYGERKGELCLYNRKTNDTIFAENY